MVIKKISILSIILLSSCSSEKGNTPTGEDPNNNNDDAQAISIKSTPLSGKIVGEDWTYTTGYVDYAEDDSKPRSIYLMSSIDNESSCSMFSRAKDQKKVFFDITPVVGEKMNQLVVFYDYDDGRNRNINTSNTRLIVEDVSKTRIKGKLYAHFDNQNVINGTFDIQRCCVTKDGFGYERCK